MIDRKREGEEVVTEMAPREPTKVIDLMDALNASVKAASGGRAGASRSRASSTRSKSAADEKKATASKKVTPVKRAAKAKKQPVAATRSRRKAS
jgi:non-homologous end joining protein Ku